MSEEENEELPRKGERGFLSGELKGAASQYTHTFSIKQKGLHVHGPKEPMDEFGRGCRINSSVGTEENPNCKFELKHEKDLVSQCIPRVIVVTLREVPKDDEFIINYLW